MYWSDSGTMKKVLLKTLYLTSELLGGAKAKHLLEAFEKSVVSWALLNHATTHNHPQPSPTTQITSPTTPNHPNYISNHLQPPKLNIQSSPTTQITSPTISKYPNCISNHPNYISKHPQ